MLWILMALLTKPCNAYVHCGPALNAASCEICGTYAPLTCFSSVESFRVGPVHVLTRTSLEQASREKT